MLYPSSSLEIARWPIHEMHMETIPTSKAERELEGLVQRATAGESIVIEAPSGDRVRLQPVSKPTATERVPGLLKDKFEIPARLFEPMDDDELKLWYGEDE